MGKIKIHEIAKKVGLASKEVIEKARELGIAVTSHLSTIENEQAEKLEQALDDGKTKNIGKKEKKVKEKETDTPVIIRRELIITDEDKKKEKQEEKNSQNRKDVGFVEREKNQNYNIVYRNKPTKPLTVNELFGIKDSKKEEQKKEEVKEVKEQAKEQAKEEMLEKETIKAQENAPTPKVQTSSTTTVESPKPEQRRTITEIIIMVIILIETIITTTEIIIKIEITTIKTEHIIMEKMVLDNSIIGIITDFKIIEIITNNVLILTEMKEDH